MRPFPGEHQGHQGLTHPAPLQGITILRRRMLERSVAGKYAASLGGPRGGVAQNGTVYGTGACDITEFSKLPTQILS